MVHGLFKLSQHMIEAQKEMMQQRDNLDKLLEERSLTIVSYHLYERMN